MSPTSLRLNRLNSLRNTLLFLVFTFGNLISHNLIAQSRYTSVTSGGWNASGIGIQVAGDVVTLSKTGANNIAVIGFDLYGN
jgi:hypothetical protein